MDRPVCRYTVRREEERKTCLSNMLWQLVPRTMRSLVRYIYLCCSGPSRRIGLPVVVPSVPSCCFPLTESVVHSPHTTFMRTPLPMVRPHTSRKNTGPPGPTGTFTYLCVSLTHNSFCISTHQLCAYACLGRLCGGATPLPNLLPGYVGILTITATREECERRLEHLGNEGQGGQIPQEVFEQLYPLGRRSLFCA